MWYAKWAFGWTRYGCVDWQFALVMSEIELVDLYTCHALERVSMAEPSLQTSILFLGEG